MLARQDRYASYQEQEGAMAAFRSFYNAGLSLSWPFLFYYYFLRCRTDGKYCTSYRYRLGLELPPCLAPSRRLWIHALSVGETLSVVALVRALKELSPETDIVFSNATETGRDIAQKKLSSYVSSFFYMPQDFPWLMNRVVKLVKPSGFVLVETDVWPNLIEAMNRYGIPSVLVNGRLSHKSHRRMRQFRSFFAPTLRSFRLIFAQSFQDKLRFESLRAPESRVRAVGNLKFDAVAPAVCGADLASLRIEAGIVEGRPVWIGGSTHEGEEEILLGVHQQLIRSRPDLLLILAPRHVHRGPAVLSLCRRHGFAAASRSRGQSGEGASVYLLDTLGELSRFYALADAAFVGGSLVPLGGHNPLEPVAQEKPAFWGPHLFNFREIEKDLLGGGCGGRIASADELAHALTLCLADEKYSQRMKQSARGFLASHSGCSREIARRILNLL
jgi:3-deoxy-D-manno-octulosonic-acid transferase